MKNEKSNLDKHLEKNKKEFDKEKKIRDLKQFGISLLMILIVALCVFLIMRFLEKNGAFDKKETTTTMDIRLVNTSTTKATTLVYKDQTTIPVRATHTINNDGSIRSDGTYIPTTNISGNVVTQKQKSTFVLYLRNMNDNSVVKKQVTSGESFTLSNLTSGKYYIENNSRTDALITIPCPYGLYNITCVFNDSIDNITCESPKLIEERNTVDKNLCDANQNDSSENSSNTGN